MPLLSVIFIAMLVAPVEDPMTVAAQHVAAGDFARARSVLDEAYAADPRPELLYSRAQVERLAGNCEVARELFEQFAHAAAEEDAVDARRLSTQCTPAEAPVVAVPHEPVPEDSVPETSSPEAPIPETRAETPTPISERTDRAKPWSRRPLPAAMLGVGLGAMGAGIGLLAYSATHRPAPDAASNEGDYGDLVVGDRRLRVAGVAVTAVGTGLVVGAAIVWAVLVHRQGSSQAGASRRQLRAGPGSVSIRF